MARISEQTIEQVRHTADIFDLVSEYVQLKKRGHNFFGLCPFHDEKTPSFSINQQRQIYKCFGCGAGGGTINFIMEIEQLEFIDAIKYIANRYNIELNIDNGSSFSKDNKTLLIQLHNKASTIFQQNLHSKDGEKVLSYLLDRGIKHNTIKEFSIGLSLSKTNALLNIMRSFDFKVEIMKQSGLFIDSEKGYFDRFRNRIMFSIPDALNNIIAFAGRTFESTNSAKYLNSPETPIYNKSRVLYGINKAKTEIKEKKSIIILEGYFDFLQLYQSGIKNCVAISGTAFTEQHALQIKRYCNLVYIAYDGDTAGKSAAIRSGYILLKSGLDPKIVSIPNGIDPDDWVKNDGNKPFLKAVNNSQSLITFHFNNHSTNIQTNNEKTQFANEVLLELSNIDDPIIQELQIRTLAELIQVSQTSIFNSMQNILLKKSKYKTTKTITDEVIQQDNKQQLLEYDLIRLCFSKNKKIREYLYNNINTDWLNSKFIKGIFDKIYIHLMSENIPSSGMIINELTDYKHRAILAEILYDIDKIDLNYKSAIDCVKRLEIDWINNQLNILNLELKNIESSNQNPLLIMQKIKDLQTKKNIIIKTKNEL